LFYLNINMSYSNIWYKNIIKLDLLYKVNILNSYNIPNLKVIAFDFLLRSSYNNYLNILHLITIAFLLTYQKPIINKTYKFIDFVNNNKDLSINITKILRKRSAFDLIDIVSLLVVPNLKKQKLSLSNKIDINIFPINLYSLSAFPQFKDQYMDYYFNRSTLYLIFDLLRFNIMNLMVSSFQIISINMFKL